jgi:hypothetical protein
MFHRHLIERTVPVGLCAAALLLCAHPAAAKDTKKVCTPAYVAYKSAIASEKAGHLREARTQLTTCMESTCGGLIPKCTAKFNQIGTAMPSVVPVITDNSGTPMVDVQVRMDGELLTSHLDGRGLPIEAGSHEFTFSTDKGVIATQKVMIVEGQRNRPVSVSLRSETAQTRTAPERTEIAPPSAPEKTGSDAVVADKSEKPAPETPAPENGAGGGGPWALPKSPLPYVIAGVGAAAVGAGVLFTVWGNKDNDQAIAQCNHNCPQSTTDHIKTMYVVADVAFATGAVGLGVATWLFASSHSTEDKPAPKAAAKFDVQPIRSGAFASVSGAF